MIRSARFPSCLRFKKQPWNITLKHFHFCFDQLLSEVEKGRALMVYRHGEAAFAVRPVSKIERHMTVRPSLNAGLSRKANKRW